MKIRKIFALGLALAFAFPSLASAKEIVAYDNTDLDSVFEAHGIKIDKKKVEQRKKDFASQKAQNNTQATVDDKKENTNEIKEATKEIEKPKLYPKTAVYSNVVDISEHQNPVAINYDKFAKDIDGAILRSSITTYKEDEDTGEKTFYIRKDVTVDRHYENLNRRNVPIGFYHYSRATNKAQAIEEANFVLDYVRGKNVSLPIYIDIEDNIRQAKASKKDLSDAAQAFVMAMKRNGYVGGIYSYPYFAKKHLTKEVRNNNEFWIADYEGKEFTGYTDTKFDAWQYAHTGRVSGYNANIDKNVLYRDYPLIMKGKSYRSMDQLVQEILDGQWSYGKERERRLTYAGYNYKKIQAEVNKRVSL